MFCKVNIILTFLFFKFVFSDHLTGKFGYARNRRNEQQLKLDPPIPINPDGYIEKKIPLNEQAEPEDENEDNIQLIPPPEHPDEKNVQHIIPVEPVNAPKNENANSNFKQLPAEVNYVQEKTGQKWPMGVVPYFIDKKAYDDTTVKRIVKQMSLIEAHSCVIFRELLKKPVDTSDSWLHITNPEQERECNHDFSVQADGIKVVLGYDCLHPDEILHSLLHALGFKDEVTHPHRDQYIRILWDNIQPQYRNLFMIQYENDPYKLVEYDPMSIMHFHDRSFSANGAATIAALVPGLNIAPTDSLSQLDIMKLKLAFSHECNRRKIGNLLETCKNSLPQDKGTHTSSGHSSEIHHTDTETSDEHSYSENEHYKLNKEKKHNQLDDKDDEKSPHKEGKTEDSTERLPNKFKSINGRTRGRYS